MSRKNTETRKRILESTLKLLEADGTNSVRMSDIAKDACVSRQAVYLHFPNRADLMIAATRFLDEIKGSDARLAASRSATAGVERLDAYIEAWGNYIPEIYGVAKALLALKDTDKEADSAWKDRMQAMREGCEAAVEAIIRDGQLASDLTPKLATDLLWTLLSVRNWEQLTSECNWSQEQYISFVKRSARRLLVSVGSRTDPRREGIVQAE